MKKSKIVIPALAMIAFSTAASIAGTVAWFTASRQVTVDAGSYAVVKTTSNLDAVLSDTGCTGTTVSGKTVSINGYLSDASFNHKQGKVFQPNDDGSGIATTNGEVALDAENFTSKVTRATINETKVYSVVTWKITFSVSFGVQPGDYGLYLDCVEHASNFTIPKAQEADPNPTPVTAKGFRMAFYGTSANAQQKVFAGLQTSAKSHYISATTDNFATGVAYGANELVYDTYTAALPDGETTRANAIARPDYLGYFAYSASATVPLSFTVVCWFEGTDENIVNQSSPELYQTVKANLKFSAVPIADEA